MDEININIEETNFCTIVQNDVSDFTVNLENPTTNFCVEVQEGIGALPHTHPISDIIGLQSELDGLHTDVTNIENTLDLKADLVDGKVPSSQLPSFVDDVLEFSSLSAFPVTGESGKIYVALDTNLTYRWSGSTYAEISPSLALGETSTTAYRGDRGKIAYDHSRILFGNPHGTTLDNVTSSGNQTTNAIQVGSVFSGYYDINSSVLVADATGRIKWNSADGTYDMGLYNGVTLQAGQEQHFYGKAVGTIANGSPVQFAGSQGNHFLIKTAVASEINANPELFMGIATQSFTNNQFGYVTMFGNVRDLNTSAYTDGTLLYFDSVNGGLTTTKPSYPNARILVCAVTNSHVTQGSLFVRPEIQRYGKWNEIVNQPSTFTPSAHTHSIADVTGLQTALDGKVPTSGTGASGTWGINISGNSSTTTKLQYARNLTIGNSSKSFDGSSDVSWSLSEIGLTIEVTYANALSLISNNQIISGALYKITGCDVNLYNDGNSLGTTIYLQGLTTNSFSKSGYGEFYNPPYNQSINGYGIWTNYMTGNFTKTSSTLTFVNNEYLIANNGATGYYAGDGLIRYNSGDWSGATSVTGNSYGATANVSFFTNPSYSIGTTVIWGGYMWTNLTGSLGSFYNDIILDSINWAKVPYSSGLYNKVLDVIDYDILSDKIVKRNEVEFNNLVAITSSRSAYFSVSNGGMYNNPIALFQWGNKYNGSSKGLSDVRIYDSIFSCINFRGNYLQDIIFENGSSHNANYYHNSSAYKLRITNNSSIYNNVFNNTFPNNIEIDNNSSISSNLFYSGSVNAIKMSNSTISSNSIWGGGIYNNFLDGSNINSNRMYSSPIYQNKLIKNCGIYSNYSTSASNGIYNNSLEQNCNIYSNTLKGGSTHGIYNNELIINCNIYNNTLNANNDNIQLNTLKVGSNIYGNNLSNISGIYINNLVGSNIYNNTINNSNIEGNTAVRSTIWGNNISTGSNIRRITLMGTSSINSLNFTSTTMSACTLNGTTFNSTASISGKQIFYLTFNGVSVSQDLSSATLFYGLTYKNVLSRADSTPVIQYIDNSNILQTMAITT